MAEIKIPPPFVRFAHSSDSTRPLQPTSGTSQPVDFFPYPLWHLARGLKCQIHTSIQQCPLRFAESVADPRFAELNTNLVGKLCM